MDAERRKEWKEGADSSQLSLKFINGALLVGFSLSLSLSLCLSVCCEHLSYICPSTLALSAQLGA